MLKVKQINELTNIAEEAYALSVRLGNITEEVIESKDIKRSEELLDINKSLITVSMESVKIAKRDLELAKLRASLDNKLGGVSQEYYNLYAGKGEKL